MTRLAELRLLLRRDRSDLMAAAFVGLLIAFTAFVSVAAIRLFEASAEQALRSEVSAAPLGQRTIRLSATRLSIEPGPAPTVADSKAEGQDMQSTFPEAVRGLTGAGSLAVNSVRLEVTNPPLYPTFVTLAYQDNFEDLADLVSGRWPQATGDQLPPVAEFQRTSTGRLHPVGLDHSADPPRHFEVALQSSTADWLGLTVGSQMSVRVDYFDPVFSSSPLHTADVNLAATVLDVTGLYRVRDPASDAWFGDPELRSDDLGMLLDQPIAYIYASVSPDSLPGLLTSSLPFEYRWRFPLLADRLDAQNLNAVENGLLAFKTWPSGTAASADVSAELGVMPLIERHVRVRAASEALLGLTASGPITLAAAAIAMAAVLAAARRRSALKLARGRGASRSLLFAVGLVEAVTTAFLAAFAGFGLAVVLVPAAPLEPSVVAMASVGVMAAILLVGTAWPPIRESLAELETTDRHPRRADPRRLVGELSVIALAAVGVYLLQQRGLAVTGAGFDPFLAAVPALIALAAAIVAVRLYRPSMAVAGWIAKRRSDLVPVFGMRAINRGMASSMPVLVLVLAVAFAAFMSVVSTSVDSAQQLASWVAVGADVRIDPAGSATALPPGIDVTSIHGVTATAIGYGNLSVSATVGPKVSTVPLQAVDVGAYAGVVAGSPIEPTWPQAFLDQPGDGPLPAIVGPLTRGSLAVGPGDTLKVTVLNRQLTLQVVEVRPEISGLTSRDDFVLVPYAALQHALGAGPQVAPTVMWLRVPADGVAAVKESIAAESDRVQMVSRYDTYNALRDEPLLGAVRAGFALTLGISLMYAVLTILAAVIMSALRRKRDVAILRTLGLNSRQQTRLTLVEHGPAVLVALPLGLALGIGIATLVASALALGALAGSSGAIPMVIDWGALVVLAVALFVVALAAIMGGAWLARRGAIGNALRVAGD